MPNLHDVPTVLSRPVRWLGQQLGRLGKIAILLPLMLTAGGGLTKTLVKACHVMRYSGFAGIKQRIRRLAATHRAANQKWNYQEWIRRYDTVTTSTRKKMLYCTGTFARKPVISVLMPVSRNQADFLRMAVKSVHDQVYPHWELCVALNAPMDQQLRGILDDCGHDHKQIKLIILGDEESSVGLANGALSLANGEYVTLLDQDDLLAPHALFWVAEAINRRSEAALIYSDEDKLDVNGRRYDPYFKCDWNYDLLLSQNFITHLAAYRTSLVRKIGGCRNDLANAQDHDLVLRSIEQLRDDQIVHIPRILYHCRTRATPVAATDTVQSRSSDGSLLAIVDHLARKNVAAEVLPVSSYYRVRYAVPAPAPRVSLVIPTYNQAELIRRCVSSILDKTDYPNYEILIIDNRSDDPAVLAYFDSLKCDQRIRVVRDDRPFNFSAINNRAVGNVASELVGLVNNDTEVITPGWLTEMVSLAVQPGVGAVGARLWYPDNRLQHAGIILGIGGVVGHAHSGIPNTALGYFGRATLLQTMSAVTAACLVIRREVYWQAGGMDEKNLPVAFNDVDFCLKVRALGYRNIWTPYAELYHYESATRGYEDNPQKQQRFAREMKFLQQRWRAEILYDPAYSPNLTLEREDFSAAWPPRVAPLI